MKAWHFAHLGLVLTYFALTSCAAHSGDNSSALGLFESKWQPTQGSTWHLQLQGTPQIPDSTQVVDLDGEETSATTITDLKARGIATICYFDAGTFEDWRSDAGRFPEEVLGEPLVDWPGQRWLDIRQLDVLEPIMAARVDQCAAKGFNAIDPDDVDGYSNATGFALIEEDSVAYVQMLAKLAHDRGLAMGLKNAPEILPEVLDIVDFAVVESCIETNECAAWEALTSQGRPVFAVEYNADPVTTCAKLPNGFSMILADLELDSATFPCPANPASTS